MISRLEEQRAEEAFNGGCMIFEAKVLSVSRLERLLSVDIQAVEVG